MDLFRIHFKSHGIFFTCVRHTTPYDNGNDFCWVLLVFHSVCMLRTVSFIQTWIYFREVRNSTDLCYYFRFYLENYVLGCDIFWSVRNIWMFLRSLLLLSSGLSSIFLLTFLNSVSQILLLWNLFGNILNTTLNKHFYWNVCFHWNIKCKGLDYSILYFRNWFILYLCNVIGRSACSPVGPRSHIQC